MTIRRRGRIQDRLSTLQHWPVGLRLCRPTTLNRTAPLTPGYQLELLEDSTDSYRISAVTDTPGVANFFERSTPLFSESGAFFILEFYPEERRQDAEQEGASPSIYYSPYLPADELLETLRPFLPRLIHDGFVGFGLANNRQGLELFFSEEKVLTCFTGNHIRMTDHLSKLGLRYNPELRFPTDFAHDHLSLLCFHPEDLPQELARLSPQELDHGNFCQELVDLFEMYPVDGSTAFFLSEKEQDQIAARLATEAEFSGCLDEDFGAFLFDWIDFVRECQSGFEGGLPEYCQCLWIRDLIQFVIEGVPDPLAQKLAGIVAEADEQFKGILTPASRRLDAPESPAIQSERFWYHGVLTKAGSSMRRDLIRSGLYR